VKCAIWFLGGNSRANNEYGHTQEDSESGRDTWRLEDSLIPRERKIGRTIARHRGKLYFMLCLRLSMQLPYSYIHT
jgi:hypothetical protein